MLKKKTKLADFIVNIKSDSKYISIKDQDYSKKHNTSINQSSSLDSYVIQSKLELQTQRNTLKKLRERDINHVNYLDAEYIRPKSILEDKFTELVEAVNLASKQQKDHNNATRKCIEKNNKHLAKQWHIIPILTLLVAVLPYIIASFSYLNGPYSYFNSNTMEKTKVELVKDTQPEIVIKELE